MEMLTAANKATLRPFMNNEEDAGAFGFGDPPPMRFVRVIRPVEASPVFREAFRGIRSFLRGGIPGKLRAGGRKKISVLAETVLRSLGLPDRENIVFRDPDTALVTCRDSVMRIPFGKASEGRCRLNARVLAALEMSPIAGFVPRALGSGRECGLPYYRESRLAGAVPGGTGKEMPSRTRAAAEFMTAFHLLTAREAVIDSRRFHRLFSRDLRRLEAHLAGCGREHLALLEQILRRRFLYAPCKTVWFHGDCRIENLLFDPSSRQVRGVTDWGLARRDGLPLLDIFSLLVHAKSRAAGRPVDAIFREACSGGGWDREETMIIERYVSLLHLPKEYVKPLLVMSWVHHAARQSGHEQRGGMPKYARKDIESILEAALDVLGGGTHGR